MRSISVALVAAAFVAGVAVGAVTVFVTISRRIPPTAPIALTGAGASFPYPLYRRWFAQYGDSTGVRINYFSVGSSGGVFALAQGEVDFGASDRPLSVTERSAMPCGAPIAIPTTLGAVAVTYHLGPMAASLRLDGPTLGRIFSGEIVRWDDRRIQQLNPTLALPSLPIITVHRSDGSGTSRAFLSFLALYSETWRAVLRRDPLRWPVGVASSGNEGVAAEVKVTMGSIGYVEASYARQLRLPVAAVRNQAGEFLAPTRAAVSAAGREAFSGIRPDSVVSLLSVSAPDAYPIASLTWLLIPPQARDTARARAVVELARWTLSRRMIEGDELEYAPLPREAAAFHDSVLQQMSLGVCGPRPIVPKP